jgi:23S rRNA maturation mini-RNase III
MTTTISVSEKPDFDAESLSHLEGFNLVEAIQDKWVMEEFDKFLKQRENRIVKHAQNMNKRSVNRVKPREITHLEKLILLAEVKRRRDTYRERLIKFRERFGEPF